MTTSTTYPLHPPAHDRKLKRVIVSAELIGKLMCDGEYHFRVTGGLPPTARFVGASSDWQSLEVSLFFTDESFPAVPLGQVPPFVTPMAERLS